MKKALISFLIVSIASCSPAKKNLVGYWYKPKSMVNLRFYPNQTFEYSDYDSVANKYDKLTGTYKLAPPVLTLHFNDKTTETFTFDKAKTGNENYHLKKGDNFFIKGERVNNAIPPDTLKSSS